MALIDGPGGKVSAKEQASPFRLRIQGFDLICRHDLDLWLPVVKSSCASDADDFWLSGFPDRQRLFARWLVGLPCLIHWGTVTGRTGNSYFHTMEFVEGETLENLIKRSA